MKDSGIDWIGEIPSTWTKSKMKYVGKYVNGFAFKPEQWGSKGKKIIRIQDLTGSNDKPNYYDGLLDEKYSITYGDVLVSWAATLDAFIWNGEDGWLNQHIFKANPNLTIIDRDYFYWLIKEAMNNMNNENKHGIMMQHVTMGLFNNFIIPLPPIKEQKIINVEIKKNISKIDDIIKKTKQTIEEYKKLKQSIITEAVTKGIRKNRKMKDSGIGWIGEIPEEWKMMRGKGIFLEIDERSKDDSGELLTVSQYTGVTPRSQKNVNMFESETLEGYKICKKGEIAANTMWLWAGAIGVSNYNGVISPSYNVYNQKSDTYNSDYLDYLLRTQPLVQCFESLSTGIRASRLRLYPEQFLGIYYPVPSKDEQLEIVEYLKNKCNNIDNLIKRKEELLNEINDYKKSLIYEYVTGKKEVDVNEYRSDN